MEQMFNGDSSLISLDVSNFDTSNVINMARMFKNCSSLTELNISNFNTSKVYETNTYLKYGISGIFDGCTNLTSLTIPKTNSNGINNTEDTIYGSTTDTSYTLTMEGRTVTLK